MDFFLSVMDFFLCVVVYTVQQLENNVVAFRKYKCKKTAVYTNIDGDIVSYTSKTAKIQKVDITQQYIDIAYDLNVARPKETY